MVHRAGRAERHVGGRDQKIKSFISRSVDRFRPSYGRHVIEAPRQSVLIGTTNATVYLKDDSGGRRFLPVQCGRIDISAIERCKHQLWAEAVTLYRQGCKWWLDDDAIAAVAAEEQDSRYLADVWEDKIADFVAKQPDVSVAEVLETCLGIEPGRWQRSDQMRVARCLTHMQFTRYHARSGTRREWRYRQVPTSARGTNGGERVGDTKSG